MARRRSYTAIAVSTEHGPYAKEFAADSLATVLRAHLIRTLIEQGIPELSFWSGTSGALSRYVRAIPAVGFYIDVPTQGWRMLRSFVSFASDWIPEKADGLASWISPPRLRTRS